MFNYDTSDVQMLNFVSLSQSSLERNSSIQAPWLDHFPVSTKKPFVYYWNSIRDNKVVTYTPLPRQIDIETGLDLEHPTF